MQYNKPHLSYEDQLQLMAARGLVINDHQEAVHNLQRIGYYRLSGYLYQWRNRPQDFKEGDTPDDTFNGNHTFEEAVDLYSFDRRLRLKLLDAMERLEVALRVQIAHVVGKRGAMAHLDDNLLHPTCHDRRNDDSPTNFELLKTRNSELLLQSNEQFAKHIIRKYNGESPIWIAVELWDLGLLKHFFNILQISDREEIARFFAIPDYNILATWLEVIRTVRNTCAHHSRLYRRNFTSSVGTKKIRRISELRHVANLPEIRQRKLYPALAVVIYMLESAAPQSKWTYYLLKFLDTFPAIQGSSLVDYGFPDDWKTQSIWIQAV